MRANRGFTAIRIDAKLLSICFCPQGTRKNGNSVPKRAIQNILFQFLIPVGNLEPLIKVIYNNASPAKIILKLITENGVTSDSAILIAPKDEPQRAPSINRKKKAFWVGFLDPVTAN